MSCPRLSIILPVFNAAETVARAIETVREQTFVDWELLLVNDGSTDATPELLHQAAVGDPRVRVFEQAHAGIVPALTLGLRAAQAPVIARMDADDEAHRERLEAQVEFLARQPEIGLVGCRVSFGGDRSTAAGYARHVDWMNDLVDPASIYLNRFVESPFAHPSVMFHRQLLEKFGGYRFGPFPEDYELWLRWLDAGVLMAKVPRELLQWTDSPRRLSRLDERYDSEAFYRCKAIYLARWLRRTVSPTRSILVWGAGRPTRRRAAWLEAEGIHISAYIDVDPHKIGRVLAGRRVIAPEELPDPKDRFVLGYVAKWGARELAREHLVRRGYVEGKDFLMAA